MKKLIKKSSILAGLVLVSLGLEGCEMLSSLPFIGGGADNSAEIAPVPVAPNAVPVNPTGEATPAGQDPNAPEAGEPDFEDPLVAGEKTPLPAPDGLIPVTSRDTAEKIVQQNQGRQNPFATLPVQIPTATLTAAARATNTATGGEGGGAVRSTPKLPIFPIPPIPPQAQQRPKPFTPPPAPAVVPQSPPEVPPLQENVPPPVIENTTPPFEWTGEGTEEDIEPVEEFNPETLPPLPEPTIANGLTVTGVVNLGGSHKAIVQDSEGKSRYVSPGEYLGSGQVLVKRIEMNRGPQPVVVFEELGMEVIRAVGEPPPEINSNA